MLSYDHHHLGKDITQTGEEDGPRWLWTPSSTTITLQPKKGGGGSKASSPPRKKKSHLELKTLQRNPKRTSKTFS